ncbi:ribosomal L1 domain-containing protein 1-like [Sycon ciliatum]|uniref:ribosomal L1 domain-containing protein 1-like n=1 Tax=Sycon ciliatum TaxID=27933 RepID=UPI0020A94081|eukprot:scpid96605/ scgid22924/ Ribosomal L1 domain-containing protein 1; CATX-11; Cellular senescence-inhibited gene protein; Protein PBK1 &gt; Ribosomal L1 domain-containing protein 1
MGKDCLLVRNQAEQAATALLEYTKKKKGKEQSLLGDVDTCSLIITVKKISTPVRHKPKRIPLKHSLHSPGETEICLFIKDDKEATRALLASKNVEGISKILTLTSLRRKYKTFEAKRQLSSLYDFFLCDADIYHLLPRYLGKKFFEKKKRPHPVDMKKKDLKGEFDKARDATYLHLGMGACSALQVGHTGMTVEMLSRNIMAVAEALTKAIPRGWRNIQSAHLKTVDSTALPLFIAKPTAPKKV